jgi:hypothetical protein
MDQRDTYSLLDREPSNEVGHLGTWARDWEPRAIPTVWSMEQVGRRPCSENARLPSEHRRWVVVITTRAGVSKARSREIRKTQDLCERRHTVTNGRSHPLFPVFRFVELRRWIIHRPPYRGTAVNHEQYGVATDSRVACPLACNRGASPGVHQRDQRREWQRTARMRRSCWSVLE